MMQVVYRDVIGDGNELRPYDCELEIVKRDTRMTRTRSRSIEGRRSYHIIIIFSHVNNSEIRRIEITPEREKCLERLAHEKNCVDEKISLSHGVAFWNEIDSRADYGYRVVFALFQDPEAYDTYLVKNGVDRIRHAARAREYLDRWHFFVWRETSALRQLESDLLITCLAFIAKQAIGISIDRSTWNDAVSHRLKLAVEHWKTDDSFRAVAVKCEILYERAMEALGFTAGRRETRTIGYFRNRLHTVHHSFCHKFHLWGGREAFVRGIYNLYLS